jgi:hypothetical protein
MGGRQVSDELETIWRENVIAKSRYYPGNCMERLKIITKNLRTAGGSSQIRTENFTNTKPEQYL